MQSALLGFALIVPATGIMILLLIALTTALLLPGMSKLFAAHGDLTDRAHAKASVFYQILAESPLLEPNSYLMVMTTLSEQELAELGLIELYGGNMFASAISVLYPKSNAPEGFFCYAPFSCSRGLTGRFRWGREAQARWHKTFVLELRPDLTVELVEKPAERYNWGVSIAYDPKCIIDFNAPLPPRARTMLATAWREANN